MDHLSKLKIELKNLLGEGLDIALKHIGEKMSPDSPKYNGYIQQKSRYSAYLKDVMSGRVSKADLDQVYNAISHACLLLIDSLTINDLIQDAVPSAAARSKRGELLYHIPHAMEVHKEHACRVRVAYLLDMIFEGWKNQEEDVNRQIRVAEIMSVELLNVAENQPFAIRAMTETVQFLESDDYTEWLFYVRPLRHGEFPLLLKVSVLEVINGREVKKDVVIEEHVIVSNEAQEETPVLKKSGVEVSLQQAPAFQSDASHSNAEEHTDAPQLLKRLRRAARPLALFLAFLMFTTAGLYATTTEYTRGYWWARVQNSEESYLEFIEKYKDNNAFKAAPEREKAYYRLSKVSENPLLVREYIQVLDSSMIVDAHLEAVVEKLKALEITEVQSIAANPTKQQIENYVTNFPEMNLLPKVVEIVNKRADLTATALPILANAAVRQIGNPNVHPVQIKMYQTVLPASQPALQKELEKRPSLKVAVEHAEYKTSDAQDDPFFYTKQVHLDAGNGTGNAGPNEKNPPEVKDEESNPLGSIPTGESTVDPNAGKRDEPGRAIQESADRDSDGTPDLTDECPDKPGEARWNGCPDSDGDGISDQNDACPTEKGAFADKGCPATVEPAMPDYGMVLVHGGAFTMGCTSEQQDCEDYEKPPHVVTVSDFYIGKYEVTQKQWRDIMGDNPSRFEDCDQCPVENVSWDDVQEFLQKLNEKHPGKNYRLPTEAEWEYAARSGGGRGLFGNGKNVADPADINFDASTTYKKTYSVAGEYRQRTVPVGSLRSPNALGLHDMSGNVYEWCSDWYGDYGSGSQINPQGPVSGSFRVCRGGSWFNAPQVCRVANRGNVTPGNRSYDLGFRLARTK